MSDESLGWLAPSHTWEFVSLSSSSDSPARLLATWQGLGMGTRKELVLRGAVSAGARRLVLL